MGESFEDQFRVRRKIGAGSFGQIYSGENLRTHRRVAIKFEDRSTDVPQLLYESKLYAHLQGGTGIPKLHWWGHDDNRNIMVIDMLGKSLEDLFELCSRTFTLKTVLMLADQMISLLEFFHQKDFVHRDIKPDNFILGLGSSSNQVFIIDYGLAKRYRDQRNHQHIPFQTGLSLTGTARYASVGALNGDEQSRRDDMEALGYVLMYLLRGDLPWMGNQCKDQEEKFKRISEMKANTPFEELCKGFPKEFVQYFRMVRNLGFAEKPDYAGYRKLFRQLFMKKQFIYDYKYDWCNNYSNLSSNNLLQKKSTNDKKGKDDSLLEGYSDDNLLLTNTSEELVTSEEKLNVEEIHSGENKLNEQEIQEGGNKENKQEIHSDENKLNEQEIQEGGNKENKQEIHSDENKLNEQEIQESGNKENKQEIQKTGLVHTNEQKLSSHDIPKTKVVNKESIPKKENLQSSKKLIRSNSIPVKNMCLMDSKEFRSVETFESPNGKVPPSSHSINQTQSPFNSPDSNLNNKQNIQNEERRSPEGKPLKIPVPRNSTSRGLYRTSTPQPGAIANMEHHAKGKSSQKLERNVNYTGHDKHLKQHPSIPSQKLTSRASESNLLRQYNNDSVAVFHKNPGYNDKNSLTNKSRNGSPKLHDSPHNSPQNSPLASPMVSPQSSNQNLPLSFPTDITKVENSNMILNKNFKGPKDDHQGLHLTPFNRSHSSSRLTPVPNEEWDGNNAVPLHIHKIHRKNTDITLQVNLDFKNGANHKQIRKNQLKRRTIDVQ